MTIREMIIVGLWVFFAIKRLVAFYGGDPMYDVIDEWPAWLYYPIGTLITLVTPFPVCAILYLIFC